MPFPEFLNGRPCAFPIGRIPKARFMRRYSSILDRLETEPTATIPGFGSAPVSCLRLCQIRDVCLRDAGFWDAYATVKADENAKALELLPSVLSDLDEMQDATCRMQAAIRGVFAGNIFDLGI
jgi:hypothetical protein